MKLNDQELELVRTTPQASKIYLGVERGVNLLTARVQGNHVEGDTTIQLTDVVLPTGDASDLHRGMTVSLASIEGNDRRVDAAFLSYDSGTQTLTISANARECDDNFFVYVFSSMKLWKVPPATDWDAPLVILGPPRMGFVGEPLSFIGSNSYSPLGRTLTTYQWRKYDATLISGSLSIPNTATNPLVLSWSAAGEYLVRLRVTDDDGKVGTRYCPVLIFDRTGENAPYSEVIVRDCKWNGKGWSATFTVYGAGGREEFPPQALVVLFAEDWYGSEKVSIGGCYRGASDVLFAGWIQGESVKVNADEQSVSFTADSIEQWMDRLTMPGTTLRQTDTDFNLLTFTSTFAVLDRLRNTTLAAIADVFLALFSYDLEIVDITQGSLLAQITGSLIGKYGYVAGSRFGSVTIARDKNLLTAEMRAGLKGSAMLFTPQDWRDDLTIDKEKFASVAQWHIEGKLGDDTPIASDYPVSGPGHNGAILEDLGWIFYDQAQADEIVELLYKRDNRRIKHIQLRTLNNRALEPAFQDSFTVNLPSAYNNRGYNWAAKGFFVTGMSFEFGDGFILVTYDGEVARFSDDGESWTPDATAYAGNMYGYDSRIGMDTGTDD